MTTATAPTTVRAVTVSYWLYIAAAVVNVIVGLSGLLQLGRVSAAVQRAQAQNPNVKISSSTLEAAATAGVIVGIVIAVVWSVLVVVFAVQMRRGRNWARIVLTVLGALSVLGIIGFGVITFLIAVAAIVFSYLPTANAHFRPVGTSTWS